MRGELEARQKEVAREQAEVGKAQVEESKLRGNALHWKTQLEREQRELARVLEALREVRCLSA